MTTLDSANQNVRVCTKTVMDNIADPHIIFDKNGVCNYFSQYQSRVDKFCVGGVEGLRQLEKIFAKIREEGVDKKYDCITGVSGGVDSTYIIYLCKKYKLRPLVVHLDNGWNSEIANQNINNIIDKSGFDLHTYVIDWEEFRDLQLSFLKASVIDLELTSDHAIFAILFRMAKKYGIKYMLNGFNITTEGILPSAWRWEKYDWLNIRAIHKCYGTRKLKTYPHVSFARRNYYGFVNNIQTVMPLNYIDYNKEEAKELISRELDWRDYGGKHFESIITRFYQGYILPQKFHVDKRKAHLSTLIASGQLAREDALEELKKPIYDPVMLGEDKEFVLKKLGLSRTEFENMMKAPIKAHSQYPSYVTAHYEYHDQLMKMLSPVTHFAKKVFGINRVKRSY